MELLAAALFLVPMGIGFLLGSLLPIRRPILLLVPALALAVVYWIAVGWLGDDYEIGKTGLVVFTGLISAAFIACWAAGIALGRFVRATWRARATS